MSAYLHYELRFHAPTRHHFNLATWHEPLPPQGRRLGQPRFQRVKRLFSVFAVFVLCGVIVVRGDENVAHAQDRLKAEGFYSGERTGVYDSETAAAVTRFQIRNGLAISGKLDAATAQALGVSPMPAQAEPRRLSGTWRRLRDGGMQFVPNGPPRVATSTPGTKPPASPAESAPEKEASAPTKTAARSAGAETEHDRLRDYVAAFILAGVDPQVGSELEFFASRVDYFGVPNVSRDKIRNDLLRYDRQWPDRRFWLEGDIQVQPQTDNGISVVFPLRYKLRNGPKRASGKVLKSLTLARGDNNQLEIVAVNERKM